MNTINRAIAIIKPKQPFLDWANQLPDADLEATLEEFQSDCLSILIPESNNDEEARSYINNIAEDIFEEELRGWDTEEAFWPKDRSSKIFWEWFNVDIHSVVMDSCDDEGLEREDY